MFVINFEKMKGNERESNTGLKSIINAGRPNSDIYSLSELTEVMNGAYST